LLWNKCPRPLPWATRSLRPQPSFACCASSAPTKKEQRCVKQLVTDLLGGMSPTNTIVVWGNGGFGPTSKGHDAAPNKGLRHQLSRFMPIVLGTEYNTSKLTCYCHVEATKMKTEKYKRRATVLKCTAKHESKDGSKTSTCGNMLGRDENPAARNSSECVPSTPRCTSSKKISIELT
jgi:hypothetical protein